MELSETQEQAIEMMAAADRTDSFALGIVDETGEVSGVFDFTDGDGSVNVEHMGAILAHMVATTTTSQTVDEYCEILATEAKEILADRKA